MAYTFQSNTIGAPQITDVTTIAPGIANLPSVILEPQLGEVRQGWDTTLGSAEFIYAKVPVSTAIAAGTLVIFTAGYVAAALPVLATSKNTAQTVAVCVNAVASSTSVQYTWFQISGQATVLKTAVTVAPNLTVFASGTAGRLKVLASAGGQILNARTANAATVTSTTSTVTLFINRPCMQGQIT
jgi:hypothetical protein